MPQGYAIKAQGQPITTKQLVVTAIVSQYSLAFFSVKVLPPVPVTGVFLSTLAFVLP